VGQLPVGEAQHLVLEQLQPHIARTVGLERGPGSVVPVPVDLDDQPAVAPHEVHLELADAHVHLRGRQPVSATQPQESPLELAAREVWLEFLVAADVQPRDLGLADRLAKLIRREDPAQVLEGASRRGYWDAVAVGHDVRRECA
jgi:hypothetical protein